MNINLWQQLPNFVIGFVWVIQMTWPLWLGVGLVVAVKRYRSR